MVSSSCNIKKRDFVSWTSFKLVGTLEAFPIILSVFPIKRGVLR